MQYTVRSRDEHFSKDGSPKRILALDGGGLRGIVTLGILAQVEEILRERHGGSDDFRLSHYFDLIAGTSTGSIIAAMLAMGQSVEDIRVKYMKLGEGVFKTSWFRQGVFRAKYSEAKLIDELKAEFGAETTLGSEKLTTGFLVVTKRVDTGSTWPMINNPRGKYYAGDASVLGNGDYPLWKVVRASTAAPTFFDPESIGIIEGNGTDAVEGTFVDGGVSPFNDPSLCAFMFATLEGCRIHWDTGADKLLVISLGTGSRAPEVDPSSIAAKGALQCLALLMDDCAALVQTMMQWMSTSPTHQVIDGDIDDLANDLIGGSAQFSYARYNVDLARNKVRELMPDIGDDEFIEGLSAMDAPENMKVLGELGRRAGVRDVKSEAFPSAFDLS